MHQMTYGQMVRAAVTESVNKTGSDVSWKYLLIRNMRYRSGRSAAP